MPVRELLGLSGIFVGAGLLFAWAKLRLWEWRRERGLD